VRAMRARKRRCSWGENLNPNISEKAHKKERKLIDSGIRDTSKERVGAFQNNNK